MNILYLIIPCYNEEEVLNESASRLFEIMNGLINSGMISDKSRIVFVDDGSKDKTWDIIEALHNGNTLYSGVKMAANKGHQNALLCGMMTVREYADYIISLDADLQDDINVIGKFVEKYNEGYDIVYGVRESRKADTLFKKGTALAFYKLMTLLGVDIIENHADYRLMNKRTLDALSRYKEVNLFLRGLIKSVGFKSCVVTYERNKRYAGESKYPFRKMLQFAIDGITSFSVKPMRLITGIGLMIFTLSLLFLVYFIIAHINGVTISGWTSTVVSIWILGGLQLLSIGVIGEYIGKIYLESKERPRYIVDKVLNV